MHQGCQHATAQNGANDHVSRTTIELVAQQQPGTQAKKHGTGGVLEKLGNRLVKTSMVGSLGLQAQKFLLLAHPALMDVAQHPHRLNHLRIAQGAVGILLGGNSTAVGGQQRRLGAALIQPADEGD